MTQTRENERDATHWLPGEVHRRVTAEDGTPLFVRDSRGSTENAGAPTLVFCDGVLCDGFIYRGLYRELAPQLRRIHWNYRGHGLSGTPTDSSSPSAETYASDLLRVLDAAGCESAVLVSHSYGAQVILEAAARRDPRIKGLIVLDGGGGLITHNFRGTELLAHVIPLLLRLGDRFPRAVSTLWSRQPDALYPSIAVLLREVDAGVWRRKELKPYFEHIRRMPWRQALSTLLRAGEDDSAPLLGQIQIPVLVIAGSRDQFIPPECSRELAAGLPRGECVVVEGASHVLPLERPAECQALMLSFLYQLAMDQQSEASSQRRETVDARAFNGAGVPAYEAEPLSEASPFAQ